VSEDESQPIADRDVLTGRQLATSGCKCPGKVKDVTRQAAAETSAFLPESLGVLLVVAIGTKALDVTCITSHIKKTVVRQLRLRILGSIPPSSSSVVWDYNNNI
jgi:hypothetical protein